MGGVMVFNTTFNNISVIFLTMLKRKYVVLSVLIYLTAHFNLWRDYPTYDI